MADSAENFDLSELARAAGVTPRTIRYYVQQGLLPAPDRRGPGTRYGPDTVARLQLIKLLQRGHWPLAKIRAHLETLDDDGVQRELRDAGSQLRRVSDSALNYVHRVLGEEQGSRAQHVARASLSSEPPMKRRALERRALSAPAAENWPVTKSTWERIRLTRDIELNVRRPLTREQNRAVERVLDAARDILSEEDPV